MNTIQATSALKVSEVARRLQVDPRTVYRMIQRGDLHGVKTGRVWRVTLESLELFLQPESRPNYGGGAASAASPGATPSGRDAAEAHAARVRAIQGKYRNVLPSVDEFIARKQEEIEFENRRWLPEER
jgi:excisionase family DNA binding protein